MENNVLACGFYLGVRRATRNFSFTVPKIGQGVTDSDMGRWFHSLNTGKTLTPKGTKSHSSNVEKSTSFSGWKSTDNAVNLSAKCLMAPDIYKVAGGDDYLLAQESVSRYKKKATEVLSRCADSGEAITEAIAAEINEHSCVVHEIKVVVLCVSDTEIPGGRRDSNTGRWYLEKTVRKFYLSEVPLDSLLEMFAEEIADPYTNVNAVQRLVAVRNDRVTPRTGRAARTSNFRIEKASDSEAMETDAKLLAAVNRIKSKLRLE